MVLPLELPGAELFRLAVGPPLGPDGDATPAFLPARRITQADLAVLTERVRRRVIRWFRMQRLLDAAAAAMLRWKNTGYSIDAGVGITLLDRDAPSTQAP